MIYSDEQHRHSVGTLQQFEGALAKTEEARAGDDWLKGVEVNAIKSQISEIQGELSHYESLKAGKVPQAGTLSLESLPSLLVETRIASGMSQADLANALGIDLQQVQQREDSDYLGVNLGELLDAAKALSVIVDCAFATSTGKRAPKASSAST